jgi:hypothetical protein
VASGQQGSAGKPEPRVWEGVSVPLVIGKSPWSGWGLLLSASALLLAISTDAKPQGEFGHPWMDSAQLMAWRLLVPRGI